MADNNPHWKPGQPIVWYHRKRALSNHRCLYCGVPIGEGAKALRNKEHLIGRNFVPKGTLDSGDRFNFIFATCRDCNGRKAELEDHLSAISLFQSPSRRTSQIVDSVALRKAEKSYHPSFDGKPPVKDASPTTRIKTKWGNAELSFGFISDPQPESRRLRVLAGMQVQALFSLTTTRDYTTSSLHVLPPSNIWYYAWYPRSDWGNPQIADVARRSRDWDEMARVKAAEGHFCALLRRRSSGGAWFWALEWNRAIRVVGCIGQEDNPPTLFRNLPEPTWIETSPDVRVREEIPLGDDDPLFPNA